MESEFQAPLNLGLTNIPLAKRLLDGPLSLHLRLRRPDLSDLPAIMSAPSISGALQGDVSIHGTYAQLKLTSEMNLQNIGVEGTLDEVSAPVRMTAELKAADSVPLLAEALASNALTIRLRRLELHTGSARVRLPATGDDRNSQALQIANARLRADAAWSPDGFEATISSFQAATSAFNLPAALSARARLTGSRLELHHLQIATPESRIEASGKMTLADRRFELEMKIPRLILGEFTAGRLAYSCGEVHGDVQLDGSVSDMALAAHVHCGEADFRVEGSVDLQLAAYSGEVSLRELAIERFLPAGRGRLNARLSVQGNGLTAADRKADLYLSFSLEDFDPAPGLRGEARGALAGAAVTLDAFSIDSVPLQVTAAGALSENREIQAQYRATFKNLAPLGPQPGKPSLASGSLNGSIGGILGALRARAELYLETWEHGDVRGEEATVMFEAEGLMDSPRATLTATFPNVHGRGLPGSGATFRGRYHDRQAQVDFSVTRGPYRETRVAGWVNLHEELDIDLDTLLLRYRRWNWENSGPVRVVRRSDGEILLKDFHLRYGEQAIQAAGSLHPSGPLAASIVVDQVEIEPWLLTFLPAVAASGRMSLDLDLTGSAESPEAKGVLEFRDLIWKELPFGRIRVASSFRDRRLDNHLQWHDGDQEILEITGTMGLQNDFPLDFEARSSSLDLARLAQVFDGVEQSGGSLDFQVYAGGTVGDPDLKGVLAIRDGVLRLASTGEPYRDIQAQLNLVGNRLDIGNLTAASSTGTLRAGGWLETDDLQLNQLYLSLQADDFKLMNTESVEARLTGMVEARGSLDALAVKGDVTLPRARIRLDGFGAGPVSVSPEDLTVSVVYNGDPEEDPAAGGEPAEPEPDSPVVRGLRTELSVRLPRNAWVVGPETAVEIQGTLLVNKSSNEPFVLGGSAQTVRGHVTYRGRKFDLERGRITFSGDDENRPILDVLARHEVSDYTITLHVEGDSSRPVLTFSSSPELPEEDILSLLAFGKTIDRLSGSEKTALSSQGAAIAGNVISGILEKRLGDTLGLDTLEVEVGDELGTGSVRGGRYVTQNLFLSYERQLGEQSGNTGGGRIQPRAPRQAERCERPQGPELTLTGYLLAYRVLASGYDTNPPQMNI